MKDVKPIKNLIKNIISLFKGRTKCKIIKCKCASNWLTTIDLAMAVEIRGQKGLWLNRYLKGTSPR